MKILAIIPARAGSKGVPGKNIKLLGGKPLIAYTIDMAKKCKLISLVIVSTEDENIAEIARNFKVSVPFLRPARLAEDNTPTMPVILDVIETLEKSSENFDAVCILQPTCPFRDENEIEECIETFIKSEADSLISVREVPSDFNPHWIFESGDDGKLKIATGEKTIISRRQDLPPAYYRDGSVYITKTAVLKKQKSLFGKSIAYRLSSNPNHVNIDTMNDWFKAEQIINLVK